MKKKYAIEFLRECARYFEKVSAQSKEDFEFFAMMHNADKCRVIAEVLEVGTFEDQTTDK